MPINHTATSDTLVWDTGTIAPGTTSAAVTFNTPGGFPYHCNFHPLTMTGTITVVAPPSVTSVNPTAGATTGGTTVTISGTNFESGVAVAFGGAMATNVSFVDSGTLTATLPAHAVGNVDVSVTNPDGGVGIGVLVFTYVQVTALPGLEPAGPLAGSTPNPLPGRQPSAGTSSNPVGALPPRRALDSGGAGGAAGTGAPAPAPLPPRR